MDIRGGSLVMFRWNSMTLLAVTIRVNVFSLCNTSRPWVSCDNLTGGTRSVKTRSPCDRSVCSYCCLDGSISNQIAPSIYRQCIIVYLIFYGSSFNSYHSPPLTISPPTPTTKCVPERSLPWGSFLVLKQFVSGSVSFLLRFYSEGITSGFLFRPLLSVRTPSGPSGGRRHVYLQSEPHYHDRRHFLPDVTRVHYRKFQQIYSPPWLRRVSPSLPS